MEEFGGWGEGASLKGVYFLVLLVYSAPEQESQLCSF